jgi:mono/diheme cytochrome c family protein
MSARSMAWGGVLFAATVSSALSQESGDRDAGERLAALNCSQCHGPMDAPGGAPSFATIAMTPTTTGESLTVFLRTPHAAMPDLILSPEDKNDLVAYILSLRP